MKAIGIDAILMDDDCNILEKKSTMIKALLDTNGDIVFTDILELNSIKEIINYSNLQDFLDLVINTARKEFENKYNLFEISGINENDEYTWNVKCVYADDNLYYSFNDLSSQHKIFKDDFLIKIEDNY